jgi:hypothetical protein
VLPVLKVAVTVTLEFIVNIQVVDVPLQLPPDQPTNVLPAAGAAVRVTGVPVATVPLQVPVEPVVHDADVTEPPFRGLAIAVRV